MSRLAYDNVPNGFDESGRGTPEDMIFMYRHLEHGGSLGKVSEILLRCFVYKNRINTYKRNINRHTSTNLSFIGGRTTHDLQIS